MRYVLSLAVTLIPAAWAQDAFRGQWEALRTAQPAGVELRVSAPKTKFYLGETIPLVLSFTAADPGRFIASARLQDRVGRLNGTDVFVVDPAASVEDPLRGLPGETGGMGGISGMPATLDADKPFTVDRILNEWVRFRLPGAYRMYVRSGRVMPLGANKPIEVVSNIVAIEIVPAPPEWVSAQIAAANRVLDATASTDNDSMNARQRAGLALRFLNTVESGVALARRLPEEYSVGGFALHTGILDSHHRTALLPILEQLLLEPGYPVGGRFLHTLAQLAVLVDLRGVMPPFPGDPAERTTWQAESQRRAALFEEKRQHYVSMLVAHLGEKTGAARGVTADALIGVGDSSRSRPAWLSGVVDVLLDDFRTLPAPLQLRMLESGWHLLRDRDVLPLLDDLYDNPPLRSGGWPSIDDLVLRRIYELDPGRGRQLILAELHRPDGSRFGIGTLMMLPDSSLPELDERFAARAATGGPLPSLLIARYATGAIVKQVEAGYVAFNKELDRQKLYNCPFPMLFYFLKYDPEFGEQELRKAFASGPCYDVGHASQSLGAHAMSPALERLAIEHLTSGVVAIKKGAAEVLGKYGSPAAQRPLWEAMEYFRSWWKGREDDLRKPVGQESLSFERALRAALAEAGGWVLEETELRRLLALCSTAECRARMEESIHNGASPKSVEIHPYFMDTRIRIAQYTVTSERELQTKLAQFSRGTLFRISGPGFEQAKPERQRIEAAIRAAGHRVVP